MTWEIAASVVLALALAGGFAWYERVRPPAKVLAVVAALAALAVVGRLAFAALPNVKPTTDIVFIAGYALGGAPGFAVGAVTALVSNIFLSQGPWTVWQMAAWGAVGVGGALTGKALRRREPSRWTLAIACAAAGAFFGVVMDVYQWTFAAEQTFAAYLAVAGTSLPYNVAHVLGNIVFALLIGPTLIRALRRIRTRFEVSWARPATIAPLTLALVALALPAVALAGGASKKAVSYLRDAQNDDGGFGAGRSERSNHLYGGWAALGLAAAGVNPGGVARDGETLIQWIRSRVGDVDETGELERTILLVAASGLDPEDFGGRDLVADLLRDRRTNGSYPGGVTPTAFAILAQRAAGVDRGVKTSARWLRARQNDDGGFAFDAGARSDVDVTGAVLQAIAAAGEGDRGFERGALGFLDAAQNTDGGFGQSEGARSNAQSTAFAVQGIVAAGENPRRFGEGDPLGYLERLQQPDGSIAYSRSSRQTPVWVTAQALSALERQAFPLDELSPVKPNDDASHDEAQKILDDLGTGAPPASGTGPGFGSLGGAGSGTGPGALADTPATPAELVPSAMVPPGFSFAALQPTARAPSVLEQAANAPSQVAAAGALGALSTTTAASSATAPPGFLSQVGSATGGAATTVGIAATN